MRAVRKQAAICPSAQDDVDVSELLEKIVTDGVYKTDYTNLTLHLLEEQIPYEEVIKAIRVIAESNIFSI